MLPIESEVQMKQRSTCLALSRQGSIVQVIGHGSESRELTCRRFTMCDRHASAPMLRLTPTQTGIFSSFSRALGPPCTSARWVDETILHVFMWKRTVQPSTRQHDSMARG